MKKIFGHLILALFVALSIAPPTSALSPLLNGQTQYYSVQMRSDRKAITYAKLIFENADGTSDLKSTSFRLPDGVDAQDLTVQQIIPKKVDSTCVTYETFETWKQREPAYDTYSEPYQKNTYDRLKQCIEPREEPVYDEDYAFNDGYYYYYTEPDTNRFEYAELAPTASGQRYTIPLKHAIKSHKKGAILVSYVSDDFVRGNFGYYTYDYRTLLVDTIIDHAYVTIDFDKELYIRDASQQRTSESGKASPDTGVNSGVSVDADYYQRPSYPYPYINDGGQVSKSASRLLKDDTLSVTGVFATNPLLLLGKEIFIGLIVLALVTVAIFLFIRHRRRHPRTHKATTEQRTEKASASPATSLDLGRIFTLTAVSAAASIIPVAGFLLAMAMSSSDNVISGFIGLLALVALVFTLLIAPLLYILQISRRAALVWSLIQVAIICLLMIIGLLYLAAVRQRDYPYPVPAIENCINC